MPILKYCTALIWLKARTFVLFVRMKGGGGYLKTECSSNVKKIDENFFEGSSTMEDGIFLNFVDRLDD